MKYISDYSLIIFDCDGTLVDSEGLSNQLIAQMMNEIGIPMTEQESLDLFKGTHFGKITDYAAQYLHKDLDFDFDFEAEYRRRCKVLFEKHLKEVRGAKDFIASLTKDYCVASNGPKVKMNTSLTVTGLMDLLDENCIFSAYDIDRFKPEPDLFLYAAAKMGATPEDCLVIEDTIPGIEAALNAKMDVWAIHHPGINDDILSYNIPFYKDFTEIKN